MCRLTDRTVRSTLVTAWRLATSPTSTSPFLAKATTDGVVREPSALAMTVGSPPSRTATTELVVPRSMPTARAIIGPFPDVRGWISRAERTQLKLPAHPNGAPSVDVPDGTISSGSVRARGRDRPPAAPALREDG